MEFNKDRVFSALNADELSAGDKVIVAMSLATMKQYFKSGDIDERIITLKNVLCDSFIHRFVTEQSSYPLAYLVERKENCTNCGSHEVCGYVQNVSKFACLNRCENWKPKTEKHYRPFRDTDELIKVWDEKFEKKQYWDKDKALMMMADTDDSSFNSTAQTAFKSSPDI